MQISDKIKILGMDYAIEQVDVISREELIIAKIDYLKQKIYVLTDIGPQKKEQAILHEIIHGIFNALGHDYTDEQLTQSFACALHQVIVDNKDLFSL